MKHCQRRCFLCNAADPGFLLPGYGGESGHLCCGGSYSTQLHWCGCESPAHVRMYGKTEDPLARPGSRPTIVDHELEEIVAR